MAVRGLQHDDGPRREGAEGAGDGRIDSPRTAWAAGVLNDQSGRRMNDFLSDFLVNLEVEGRVLLVLGRDLPEIF